MDKSWIMQPRNSPAYEQGVRAFIDFASQKRGIEGEILCPCPLCGFRKWQKRDVVYDHLICRQFPKGYTFWFHHGETNMGEASNVAAAFNANDTHEIMVDEDPMQNMINDAFGVDMHHLNEHNLECDEDIAEGGQTTTNEAKEFFELAKDGEQPLYEGCTKYSKLSFVVKLYHIKRLCGMTDKAMTMVLELLQDAFDYAKIPKSFYEAKKTITKLGLDYQKIDACPKNCMLYWGVNDENMQTCKVCHMSRWKTKNKVGDILRSDDGCNKKKVPAKVVRYFPLKPRLQRLFLSSKTANDMRWHAMDNNNDGMMRHPRDSEAWKKFDSINTSFALDPRNVRLGLATDGFNPFGNMSSSYSIWPIIVVPYNTPPWVCMKSTSFIISTIIPGKQMPGNDIDVYLQPLIKELKELWHDGVDAYDSVKREMFKLYAALLWTISDFPGLGTLSGWNTYTGLACPTCNFDSIPCRLPHSRKWCFMGHRRFLDQRHRFRLNRIRFNGQQELRHPPKIISGFDVLDQVQNVDVIFGRSRDVGGKGKRVRGNAGVKQWKKKSIFFDLPYWESNLLRHNLDVMHIEKNVFDNILYTLLGDSAKSKDHLNARKDLIEWKCKSDLWPSENGKYPLAIYTMNNKGKKAFLSTLKNISVPDGYSSNISRCIDVDTLRVNGMLKSHDCHVLMQQLLPLAMRVALPEQVSKILIELCSFFKQICSKVLNATSLERLQHEIVLTLCHMEMLFPPSFFTVMVHLIVHFVDEVKLGGPVHYRWMYPIERFNRPGRVDDACNEEHPNPRVKEFFLQVGNPLGGSSYFNLTLTERLQAHRHVLINCPAVDRYLKDFRVEVRRRIRHRTRSQAEVDKIVHREFVTWFSKWIVREVENLNESDKAFMLSLGQGPIVHARRFNAYNVNRFKFRTLARDNGLKTQNSGVYGSFGTRSYYSNNDPQMRFGDVLYYGKLVDIIEINYCGLFTVPLFKCQWANTTNPRGIKKDKLGFTSINFNRLIHTGEHEDDEPYIKASEAQMVYYVDDEIEKGWSIPVHLKPKDLYDMGEDEELMPSIESFPSQNLEDIFFDDAMHMQLARPDADDEPPSFTNHEDDNDEVLT
ncbi:uncharacterized protein LOC133289743 [Gastrolobium bilobum]|uniref:uncharacterized protein LOC133289743 n=1 Tax=Gastrolobium bilobum TaxID=150636 RepID=UPI002AB1E707|nr:uncharacterized protein LOC133289743 [Gastrolobium bilobum]